MKMDMQGRDASHRTVMLGSSQGGQALVPVCSPVAHHPLQPLHLQMTQDI